jgi:hypothetical protein
LLRGSAGVRLSPSRIAKFDLDQKTASESIPVRFLSHAGRRFPSDSGARRIVEGAFARN